MPQGLQDIDRLRGRIFRSVLAGSISVGLLAYVLTISAALWYHSTYFAVVPTLVFAGLIFIHIVPGLSYAVRAGCVMALLYGCAIASVPISGALATACLFLSSIGAAMQFRPRVVVATIVLNAAIVFAGGYLGYLQIFSVRLDLSRALAWSAITANFALINTAAAVSVSMLVRGLHRALLEARAMSETLEAERAHILETHEMLKRAVVERRHFELEHDRMAMAIEQAHDVVVITDVTGRVIYVNGAHERLTGRPRAESIGQSMRTIGDGTQYDEVWAAVDGGNVWNGRIRFTTAAGRAVDAELTVSPMRDEQGQIVNFVGILRDITRELLMEDQLHRSQKLEALGTLAGGIAHDFNNILMSIHGFTELAKHELPEGTTAQGFLDQILRGSCRARDLVRQILTFSRQVESVRQPVLTLALVKETLRLLRASIPTTIEIVFHAEPDAGMVFADPTQVHQVVMNLCTNAFHAMEASGGTLTVHLSRVGPRHPARALHQELRAGQDYVRIAVADTGPGIENAIAGRIFDPFFTTKEPGKGTGLGLATVHGIVSGLDGLVAVNSEAGEGAEFEVYLPRVEMPAPAELAGEAHDPVGAGERILLVDDEAPILELGQQMLADLGYEASVCARPLEALDVLRTDPGAFQVLITDQTMPGMTGTAMAARVRAFAPALPIVVISGFSEAVTPDTLLQSGVNAFLQKPFTRGDLARILQRVLHERPAPYAT